MFGLGTPEPCDKERILIVDDEAPIRRLFHMILTSAFPEKTIDQACNGIEAVRLFREGYHGAIMMDLRMPEMDGHQAFLEIQNICRSEKRVMPPVIFCTGFALPSAVNEIVGEQTYHMLMRKPVKSEDVIQAVTSRLALPPPAAT